MQCPACQYRAAFLRNLWILGAVLLLSLTLAVYFRPWMGAGTHPLVVDAELDPGAKLEAVLADGWRAPLVRADDGFFVTELPPRSSYSLSVRASGGVARISGAWVLDLHVRPVGTLLKMKPDKPIVLADGSSSELVRQLPVTNGEFGKAFAAFFCLLLLFAYGFAALVRKSGAGKAEEHAGFNWWQWGILALLAFCNVWLVATSTPVFWPADSIGYAGKALALYRQGQFYTNGIFFEITRAPGAPLVEALAFLLFGVSSGAVALLQAILYVLAAAFALDALARFGPKWVALVAAPFVFLDPAAVGVCRTFSSEAPFLIFALLFSGCFLRSFLVKGWREWLWIALAGIAAAYLVLIRPNGVVLLALPIFLIGRYFFGAVRGGGWRTGLRSSAMALVIVVASLGTLCAWSWRNYRVQGYFAPTDIAGLSAAEACFKSGILDVRASADDEAFYADFVKARRTTNYNFESWALAAKYRALVEAQGPVDKSAAKKVDLMQADFAGRTNEVVPKASLAARFARLFRWGVFLDEDPNYQPYGAPEPIIKVYPDKEWNASGEIIAAWCGKEFAVPQKPLGPAQVAFNAVVGVTYRWGLVALVAAALAAFVVASWRVRLAALAFLLPYFGNILLNAWLGVVVARYVYVLEPFLILGIAACVVGCLAQREAKKDVCG
jgi:hypothetical protein